MEKGDTYLTPVQDRQSGDTHAGREPTGVRGLDYLCKSVLPVWAGQVEAARTVTDQAIIALSQRFYGLSKRIKSTVDSSGGNEDILHLLQDSQSDLTSVVTLLQSSLDEKKALVQAVLDLSVYIKELKSMAEIVSTIARQTNMLAINAAIEAAHAGNAGRGFSVVANEIRQLSNHSSVTGKQIAEKVSLVNTAINGTMALSREFEQKDLAMISHAEEVVADVVSKFGAAANAMADTSEAMRAEGQHVVDEISQVLVSLQFQDRVTQMLSHIQQDITRLEQTLAGDVVEVDANQWLAQLSTTYTMQQQHDVHHRYSRPPPHGISHPQTIISRPLSPSQKAVNLAVTDGSDDITFF